MKKTRSIAMAVAAGATLVAGVAAASPANAAIVPVTKLPGHVTINAGDSVSVNVPNAAVCPTDTNVVTDFKAFTPGKQSAVTLATAPGAGCSAGQLNYTINDNTASMKKNGVVKFTAMKSDGSKVVLTLVVHIKGQKSMGSATAADNKGKGNDKGNS